MLLSTWNGERYLGELLESVYAQRGVHVRLWARDDGSADGTREILRREAAAGRLDWYAGDNLGPAGSFLELMRTAPHSRWYAFCDQDDVWLPDKLERALGFLRGTDGDRPALYCGAPILTDASLRPLPDVPRAREQITTFGAALIAGNASGCTMVFNRRLLALVSASTPAYVTMHDDWVHKVCLLFGGEFFFDENVPLLYRQHGGNCVGTPSSDLEKLRRHLTSLRSRDCTRSRTAASLYECYADAMTPEQRSMTERAMRCRDSLTAMLRLACDRRIRTPYLQRNILFLTAVLLKAY
ncbi:MAG: glycosyltransferase [Oscillospiraceae bacterium]|nr:glycosyltransferase [Oscillospiraceae bacterium]